LNEVNEWIQVTIILHNILKHLNDDWDEEDDENNEDNNNNNNNNNNNLAYNNDQQNNSPNNNLRIRLQNYLLNWFYSM
jgi:hypothetical protein